MARTGNADLRLVEDQGIAPCIPVWKTGVYLSTPMLVENEMESRVRVALTCAVLQTGAWAAWPTGLSKSRMWSAERRIQNSGRVIYHPPAAINLLRLKLEEPDRTCRFSTEQIRQACRAPACCRRSVQPRATALAIVELGTNASPAVPIFLRHLEHPNHFYRERAADALGNLHIEPETIVPALTHLLRDDSKAARYLAIRGLGSFEFRARSAMPALTALLSDAEDGVRKAATNTLRKIAPEVISNAPSR